MRQNDRYIIIINTPDTNKKEIGCNFKNCSRISFCITQKKPTSKNSFWVGPSSCLYFVSGAVLYRGFSLPGMTNPDLFSSRWKKFLSILACW